MTRVHAALLTVLALSASSCADRLGSTIPECDVGLNTGIVIQIQAVPSASLVPCISSLPTGWEYDQLDPRSGSAEFSIDSDRMGAPFLRVRTTPACDVSGVKTTSMDAGVDLYKDVDVDATVPIVFVAEGPTDETIAAVDEILVELVGRTFNGRRPQVTFDRAEGSTSEKIRKGRSAGAHVIVVGLREAEEGTVSLLLADADHEQVVPVGVALHIVEEVTTEPAYRGTWYYPFEGGCTEYVFEAEGPDTLSISRNADASLRFVPTEPIKEMARADGYAIP